ncbi:substrate-binding domain-containing protein [Clostridium butyricum]|uniref:substrate-binding domain-containing protein n=1 Tax=Clostridium butyricum TaxID=1492 RepID=UPI00374E4C50
MKKVRKKSIFILGILLLISFVLLLNESINYNKKIKTYEISIITRGKSNESWMILKQGAEQAADEMNANIRFINLSSDNGIEEQQELVQREIKNGADSILISPIDSNKISNIINEAEKHIPIISIESCAETNNLSNMVTSDNYKLGRKLGEYILKDRTENIRIAIASNCGNYSSEKERQEGIKSILDEADISYEMWNLDKNKDNDYYNQVQKLIQNKYVDVIVAFDPELLEVISQVKKDINMGDRGISVYGSGNTSKIISFLEEGVISGITIQNEFNIGYLGVRKAINKINGKNVQADKLESTIITKENMYTKENQRILFLFIR